MAYTYDENGNYKRTVRCSHCWEKGHNKSSCPDRKKQLQASIKTLKERLATDEYEYDYGRENDQRRLVNVTEQLSKMMNKGKGRKCSYCDETGHNRRSCPKRKQDIGIYSAETRTYREKFLEKMREIGLGVGAIVRETIRVQKDDGFEDVAALAYVESVDWLSVDHRDKWSDNDYYYKSNCNLGLRLLGDYVNRWGEKMSKVGAVAPASVANTDNLHVSDEARERGMRGYPGVEIVSGVDSIHPPKEFFDDEAIAKWITSEIVDAK